MTIEVENVSQTSEIRENAPLDASASDPVTGSSSSMDRQSSLASDFNFHQRPTLLLTAVLYIGPQ